MRFAILEDEASRVERMHEALSRAYPSLEQVHFDAAQPMNEWLARHLGSVSLLSLDHDLGPSRPSSDGNRIEPGTGRQVVDFLVKQRRHLPVIVHSSNATAATGMILTLESAGWSTTRITPFSDLEWIDAVWLPAVQRLLEDPNQAALST